MCQKRREREGSNFMHDQNDIYFYHGRSRITAPCKLEEGQRLAGPSPGPLCYTIQMKITTRADPYLSVRGHFVLLFACLPPILTGIKQKIPSPGYFK